MSNYDDFWDSSLGRLVKAQHEMMDRHRQERFEISERLIGVDIEKVISSGLRLEELGAVFGVSVEEIESVYGHERKSRAEYFRSGRNILIEEGTGDYLFDVYNTGSHEPTSPAERRIARRMWRIK
ncbi:hypothetical protein [Klebsiella pneumoniae]|uniref:hypothetical protein n=1 Tax=Klebsiella pneumoniae TaxID=573 RepID=UPI000D1BA644|nr:hypothetical protein [Klebsiella pneumoniae]